MAPLSLLLKFVYRLESNTIGTITLQRPGLRQGGVGGRAYRLGYFLYQNNKLHFFDQSRYL